MNNNSASVSTSGGWHGSSGGSVSVTGWPYQYPPYAPNYPGYPYPCTPAPEPVRPLRSGWACPKCGKVWAPWFVGPCDCQDSKAARKAAKKAWRRGPVIVEDPCAHPYEYQCWDSTVPYCQLCGSNLRRPATSIISVQYQDVQWSETAGESTGSE